MSEADTSQGPSSQRPDEKKAKVERPTVERDTSSVDTPTETAESGGFQDAPKRRRRQRSGVGRKRKHGGGKSAQADSNPSKHGAEPAKARHEFVGQREELMKPVKAFGDRVRFLPSIPATDARPIRNIGWNNALVEMAQQSRAFVRMYAGEHLRLVAHIKRLGLD